MSAKLRIGAGVEKLIENATAGLSPDARGRPEGDPGAFEEGQLSGPSGPRFVGFGEPVLRPLWRDLAENAAFGIGVGAALFALMVCF